MGNNCILLANGCSMCYGSGLYEDPITKLCFNNHARLAASWSGVLGQELGFQHVINLGYPGSSNDRIVRTTIAWIFENWLNHSKPVNQLFVVIGLSGSMRREFFINEEWCQLIPYHDYADPSISFFNRVYRETAWSEYESAIRFAIQVVTLQEFFHSYKIPYLFFDAITSFNQINIDSGNALDLYLPYIAKNNYFNFDIKEGDMATQVGCNLNNAKRSHPDVDGHKRWALRLASFATESKLFPILSSKENPISFEGTGTVNIFDRKIGLSTKPPSTFYLNHINSMNNNNTFTNPEKKETIFSRIKNAWRRDPFIYD